MMKLPKTFLRGSIPPLITPFRNGKVDYDAYAGLVEFQVRNGSTEYWSTAPRRNRRRLRWKNATAS